MNDGDIHAIVETLRETVIQWERPVVEQLAETTGDPFKVLIATLLSLRTKDDTVAEVTPHLFAMADTPQAMLRLPPEQIEETIFPVGFYRNKTRSILQVCRILVEEHSGQVPADLPSLLALPGVGMKTANLVLGVAFHQPAICVDTHVHRISNRWGYISTQTPDKTEAALREKLPREYWIEINRLLVSFGQNLCRPLSPHCSRCPIFVYCGRVGVGHSR